MQKNIKKKWKAMWKRPVQTPEMKRDRILVITLVVFYYIVFGTSSTMFYKASANDEPLQVIEIRDLTSKDYIKTYAKEFGVDSELLYDVMMCESMGKKVKGDGGLSLNEFQWQIPTWSMYEKMYSKEFGETKFDIHSLHDQSKLTAYAFSKGESARNMWTAYRAIKNGGTYSFYSKQLKGHYTAKCDVNKYNL